MLIIWRTDRGFEFVKDDDGNRVLQQSSSIGEYPDAFDKPGSSALWIGDSSHNRESVQEVIKHLQHWLLTGSLDYAGDLPYPPDEAEPVRMSGDTGEQPWLTINQVKSAEPEFMSWGVIDAEPGVSV